jgi:asparagine synthetase B (glutamine-hydrolysing)
MNSLSCAVGSDAPGRTALAAKMLKETLGAQAMQKPLGDGAVALSRTGDALLGQAQDGDVSLILLGTIFAEAEAWSGDTSPIEDPDATARWMIARYRRMGLKFLDGVIGQFAAVLHDGSARRWLFAADPFGGRSLFVSEQSNALVVSSKLDLAAAMLGDALELDRSEEDFFLVHGFYPGGGTPFRGVRSLAAGEMLEFAGGNLRRHGIAQPDWGEADPAVSAARLIDPAEASRELETLFLDATRSVLPRRKQVIGILLGGFDSALVAAAIARLGYPVVTYSFHYAEGSYNQPHTDTLAAYLGCEHRWIDIDLAMIEEGLENFPHLFSQPTNWPNYVIQTLRVMERMREEGIAYCYSGDGCDAAFLGYPGTYARARLIGRLPRLPTWLHRPLLALAARPTLERSFGHPWRVALGLLRGMGRPAYARDYLSFRIMDETSLKQLRPGSLAPQLEAKVEALSKPHAALSGVRRTYLGKAAVSPNRSKMIASADATGIPILAPYMHPALKRFALALPVELLRPESGGPATGKSVLSDMAVQSGLLPYEIVHQPKMAAVDAPVDQWYAGPLRERMMAFYEDLPFAANRRYLARLLDVKWAEGQFKRRIMTDKVISHAASLLGTYARFASLARR